jgi:uroporphyrinogen decarboxylase
MNHRERMQACLRGEQPDRTPVAIWRHFPVDDQNADTMASAHIHFQQTFDWDFLKVTPASGYFLYDWGVESVWNGHPHGTRDYTKRVIENPEDWAMLELPNIHSGHLGSQLTALNKIVEAVGDDTPVIFTIFNPLSQAKKLAGDKRLIDHLHKHPDEVIKGLETITEVSKEFVLAVINESGADGIFFAVQHAQAVMMREEEYLEFGRPYDYPVLQAAADGWLNVLHLHGEDIYFNQFTDYPVQVINWHDLETKPDLATGLDQYPGVVCGGIRQEVTLNLGTAEDVRTEATAAITATSGKRFILGTGCVAPTTTPFGNLMATRKIVEE